LTFDSLKLYVASPEDAKDVGVTITGSETLGSDLPPPPPHATTVAASAIAMPHTDPRRPSLEVGENLCDTLHTLGQSNAHLRRI
jgi:hypothetical protein